MCCLSVFRAVCRYSEKPGRYQGLPRVELLMLIFFFSHSAFEIILGVSVRVSHGGKRSPLALMVTLPWRRPGRRDRGWSIRPQTRRRPQARGTSSEAALRTWLAGHKWSHSPRRRAPLLQRLSAVDKDCSGYFRGNCLVLMAMRFLGPIYSRQSFGERDFNSNQRR